MSKTREHYEQAARHHERAAYHYKEATKYNEAEELEKAAHHAYLAHGHDRQASHHGAAAARLHAERYNGAAAADSAPGVEEKDSADEPYIFVSKPC